MDLKVIVSVGLLSILGFLFYPRGSGQKASMVGYESKWISTQEILKDEPLHGAKIHKDDPVVQTYDLRYIYKVDRAEIRFSQNPKNYDVLASTVRNAQKYGRLTSKDEYYPVISLLHKEARWVQVVANDWQRTRPNIKSVRISARYSRHSQVKNIRTQYNPGEVFRLIDGLKKENAPRWFGGKRVEKEVEKDEKKVKEVTYGPLRRGGTDITFDLGIAKRIYGTAVTTGGDENNLKQYEIAISDDRRSFQQVYVSGELKNETSTDSHTFANDVQARYVRLRVPEGGWYGNYPEITEVEIYTDEYRPSDYDAQIQEYNASQVYYDNCGMAGNAQAPNVIQGFPFDRGEGIAPEDRYFLKPDEEAAASNSPGERSFSYHYDTIILRYPYLEPEDIYWTQVTYLQEKDGKRIQSLDVDGFLLHDDMAIPANEAGRFTYAIPPVAYADGQIELHFNRLAGPNAVVSEVSLLRASKNGAVAVSGAATTLASAPMVSAPVVIDGVLDEWPDIYPMIPREHRGDPLYSPGRMYVQWDNDSLYIALKVNRRKLNTEANSSTLMQSPDTLHVFVDASLGRSPGMYRTGDHHFRFSRLGTPASERRVLASQIHHHLDAIPRTIEDNRQIEVAATLASGNSEYTLEARIPKDKTLYEFSPQPGGVIGFNYILSNPNFDGKGRQSRPGTLSYPLFWSATEVSAPPVSWGRLELVGTVSGQPAIMDQSLTRELKTFRAGETLALAVRDPDRNTDRDSPQSIKVRISGDLTKDSKEIVLHETTQALFTQASESAPQTANNSDLFAGKLLTEFSATPSDDPSSLAVQGKETITLEYLDPYYGPDQHDVGVLYAATAEIGTTGAIHIVSESGTEIRNFNAGDRLVFRVEDGDEIRAEKQVVKEESEDAQEEPPVTVSVTVVCAEDSEEVTLVDEANSGTFIGSIETIYSTEGSADGILQVEGYDVVKAIYVDSIQDTGNTNVPVEEEAIVNIGSTGLLSVGRSNTGRLEDLVSVDNFNAGYDLIVLLRDSDINIDKTAVEQVEVEVNGDTVQDTVLLTLTETEPGSSTFSGVLNTVYGLEADRTNDVLEVRGSEVATFIYSDALQATGATSARVSRTAVVNTGNDGVVSILKPNYLELEEFNAGDRLYFKVDDADLNLDSGQLDEVEISVSSEKTLDGETVVLRERNPRSGVLFGSLGTEYAGQAGDSSPSANPDNILQVQGNEVVTAIYLDTLRDTGETNVSVTDTCRASVGTTGRITVYNKLNPYTPIAGFPDEGWENQFKAGDTLLIRLEDLDLNLSSAVAEIFQISTTEDVISDSVSITLTEATGSAGAFVGEVKTDYGIEAIPSDGVLQVQGEGRVNIFYRDTITGTGETEVLIPVTLIVQTGTIGSLQAISTAGYGNISSFSAGDEFIIQVRDGDLNADPNAIDQATIIIRGTRLEDELQILLQETELDSGVFAGRVQSMHASQPDLYDSVLQVEEKEILFLTYIDKVGVTGETNMPVSLELVVRSGSAGELVITDENGRELPNLNAGRKLYFRLNDFVLSNISPNTPARIIVSGNKTGDSEEVLLQEQPGEQGIYIGSISTNYGTTPVQDGILQVRGGEEVSATYNPRTPGAPSGPIVDTTYANEGSAGRLTIAGENGLKLTNFNAGDTLYIKLEDFDLNLNSFALDTVDIWIVGDAIADGKTVTLKETGEDTGIFNGSIDTRYGRGVFESRSILEVVVGEQVTAVYYDALNNLGETDVRVVDTCRVNMLGTAPFASRNVIIDGSLAEWPLENALRAGDQRSNVYIQWDKDNLYILAYVMDSDVVVPDATQFWNGADALEIHIDTDPTSDVSPYLRGLRRPSSYFFWFCPKGAGPDGSKPYVGQNLPETVYNYTAIQTAARIFPGSHYVLEARIPFDPALGGFDPYKTSKADRVGFNYVLHRSNAPQLRWAVGTESEPSLLPSFFGTLILKQP
ncbi:sugar-binding protein [Candidatus Poribacteria bacterium]